MKRIESGIPGLDDALYGGFPIPSVVILLGEPGTGKTTLALQSLFHGARKGENTIYMTGASEPVFMIRNFMSDFKFFDEALIESGRIQFWDLGASMQTLGPKGALDAITDIVSDVKPTRVIIDPLPPDYIFPSLSEYRKYLFTFFTTMRSLGVFTLVVGEKSPEAINEIEAYMVDGVIFLHLKSLDNPLIFKNLLRIRKMRGTDHIRDMLAVDLSTSGMRVFRME